MTKINGYEDFHMVNGSDDFADKLAAHEVQCMQNDQFKAGFLLGRKYAARTREELVEVASYAYARDQFEHQDENIGCCTESMQAALDALIAIGAVRVK